MAEWIGCDVKRCEEKFDIKLWGCIVADEKRANHLAGSKLQEGKRIAGLLKGLPVGTKVEGEARERLHEKLGHEAIHAWAKLFFLSEILEHFDSSDDSRGVELTSTATMGLGYIIHDVAASLRAATEFL